MSDTGVVGFRSGSGIVETLRELLAAAERGEAPTVIVAWEDAAKSMIRWNWTGESMAALALCSRVEHKIHAYWDERT